MKKSHFLAALLLVATSAFAQAPFLVTDLNSTTSSSRYSSSPENFAVFNGKVVFTASSNAVGKEPWQYSNGSASLLADIYPGSTQGVSSPYFSTANGLVFSGRNRFGTHLWKTDGTSAGTAILKQIATPSASVAIRAQFGNQVIFTANDGVHGSEPWITDGTEGGTRMLVDLDGTSASTPLDAVVVGSDRVFLFARDTMWVSNGTPEGTVPVAVTVNEEGGRGVAIGSTAYFLASTPEAGRELWKSDGTAAGTMMVKDVIPGSGSGFVWSMMAELNGRLYFLARDGSPYDLWTSDGTAGGTYVVKPAVTKGYNPPRLIVSEGLLYVTGGEGLVRSDGSAAGTYTVADGFVVDVVPAFSRSFFARTSENRSQLWSTDGTLAGTGPFGTVRGPSNLAAAGGKLYFGADNNLHGVEPWVCEDGTAAGTHELANIYGDEPPGAYPSRLTAAGNLLYFYAWDGILSRSQLFRSDGTAAGTFRVTDFGGATDPVLTLFTGWKNSFLFKESGNLWRSDGTVAGTARVWPPGVYGGLNVTALFPTSTYLYASDSSRMWASETGTQYVNLSEGLPSYDQTSDPGGLAEFAGRVYVTANRSRPGLFLLGNSAADTRRVADFGPRSSTTSLAAGPGAMFFECQTADRGSELWRSDGTIDGTMLVKGILPGTASSWPSRFVAAGKYVYFTAMNASGGRDLWRTDGTEAGTIVLRDSAANPSIEYLTPAGDLLYFAAAAPGQSAALWRTDGTVAGTQLVTTMIPYEMRAVDDTLYFTADDGVHGHELWRSIRGGAPELVADIQPGAEGSHPSYFTRVGSLLYFNAYTSAFGGELWALPLTNHATAISISDARVTEGDSGTRVATFVVTREGTTSGVSSVSFATADAIAVAGTDYVAQSGTLSFAAGETTKAVSVTINGDTATENTEAFLVMLSAPSGAVIRRGTATGLIEDDDHRADLRIEWVIEPGSPSARKFRVVNSGPSTATDVRFRYSESPGDYSFTVTAPGPDGYSTVKCQTYDDPMVCSLLPLGPGASMDVVVSAANIGSYTDPELPPGRTIQGSISAAEPDPVPANNSASQMLSASAELLLPPFLTSNTQASGYVVVSSDPNQDRTYTITSSSPNVTLSVPTVVVPRGQTAAQFTLNSGPQSGTTLLTMTSPGRIGSSVVVPVVSAGATAKLDVAIITQNVSIEYGATANIVARVAAVRHDGTRPTGTVSLFDGAGTLVATQALTNGGTTFARSGLSSGIAKFTLRYSGDGLFNALAGAPVTVNVAAWRTTTAVSVPPMICGEADITVYIRNTRTSAAPSGTVEILIDNNTVGNVALSPTGVAGESRAVLHRTFAAGEASVRAVYSGTNEFGASSSSRSFVSGNCLSMNLVATGSGNQVTLNWSAVSGAAYYVIEYAGVGGYWTWAGQVNGTSFVYGNLPSDCIYLFTVRASTANGTMIGRAMPDLANTFIFTNDPLVPRSTRFLRTHHVELQNAASALADLLQGTGAVDALIAAGGRVRAADMEALRAKFNGGRISLGLAPLAFTPVVKGTPIRAQHMQELRDAVK